MLDALLRVHAPSIRTCEPPFGAGSREILRVSVDNLQDILYRGQEAFSSGVDLKDNTETPALGGLLQLRSLSGMEQNQRVEIQPMDCLLETLWMDVELLA